MSDTGWLMRIEGGLSAHFVQPDGPSLPGTDWSVGLMDQASGEEYKAIVRAIVAPQASDATRADSEYQARTAMQYLNDRILQGWHPRDAQSHEIFIGDPRGGPPAAAAAAPPAAPEKPWWKLW